MIDLKNVTKVYEKKKVIDNLTLHLSKGECVAVIGKKESGKTTLLQLISRKEVATSGEIHINQVNLNLWYKPIIKDKIAYITPDTELIPFFNVNQNMMQAVAKKDESQESQKFRCKTMLTLVGLDPSNYGSYYPYQLSSEEKQKLNIARVWVRNPDIVLLDNPFSECKQPMRDQLGSMFHKLQEETKKTVLFVTEDAEEGTQIGKRVYTLRKGKLQDYLHPKD